MTRSIPFVAQMEAAECGAACLSMALSAHGHHAPLAEVRDRCGVTRDGVSARAIAEAATSYGFRVRAARLEIDDLARVAGIAILHWDLCHFVILERTTRDGARIVDPGVGPRTVTREELDRSFSGIVLELQPGPGLTRRRATSRGLARYRPLLAGTGHAFATIAVASLLVEIAGLVVPAAAPIVFDQIVAGRQDRWLPLVAAVLAAAIALRALLGYTRDRVVAALRVVLDVRLLSAFVDRLLALPIAFFHQRAEGDLMSRVGANVALREVSTQAAMALLDGAMVVAYAAMLIAFDAYLGAIVAALSTLRVAAAWLGRRRIAELLAAELVAGAREEAAAVEAFAQPEVIKACGGEAHVVDRFTRGYVTRLNKSLERRAVQRRNGALGTVIDGAIHASVLWLGGVAVLEDRMTTGVLSAFLATEALLAAPLVSLVEVVRDLTLLRQHLARLDDVLEAAPEPRGDLVPARVHGHVRFESVTYRRTRGAAPVLEGITFEAVPGDVLAIVGRSGCGKSTILQLLLGFADPSEGRVLIDGCDLRELDRVALREHIGFVSQDDFFFDLSVRDNLTLGMGSVSDARVRAALRAACVDDVVDHLPQGADTRLGTGARRLSGGQRQRLALARALLREPSVLVLDEATSSLDRALERRVTANLRRLGCTRVVVAHRLETVRDADRIVVIEAGRVVQCGRYDDLVATAGAFRTLQGAHA